jgi:hypothetical protein
MYFRHYRHNPLFASNPPHTISDIEDEECLLKLNYFDSILKARAFLKQIECLPNQKDNPEMQKKIAAACLIINRANKRNTKRRIRRAHTLLARAEMMSPEQLADPDLQKRIADAEKEIRDAEVNGKIKSIGGPNLCVTSSCAPPQRAPAQRARVTATPTQIESAARHVTSTAARATAETPTWEEVLGPKGEVIRFKLKFHTEGPQKGQIKERSRVRSLQVVGDIIMDLTCNWSPSEPPIKAWRILDNGSRDSIVVTKQMVNLYKESMLYKVRQLTAGSITPAKFLELIKGKLTRRISSADPTAIEAHQQKTIGAAMKRKKKKK